MVQGAAELAAFVRRTGRLPDQEGSDPREADLGAWLAEARYRACSGGLERAERAELDATVPGWLGEPDPVARRAFGARAVALEAFFARTGSLPSTTSPDPAEFDLARWLIRQRARARTGRLGAERAALLDHAAPPWRQGRLSYSEHRLAEVEAFVAAHGRLPERYRGSDAERRLGARVANWRSAARQGRLPERTRARLEALGVALSAPEHATADEGQRGLARSG